ncbi:MAG: hypothetical protein HWE23_07760 [Rhodobacteraceae bacterium]|nr:hypothetical protein [Paracoccaceae bacterium]
MQQDNSILSNKKMSDILEDLALIDILAFSLTENLAPLDEDDLAHGAEPLTYAQIKEELDQIRNTVFKIVTVHLEAEAGQWSAATEKHP